MLSSQAVAAATLAERDADPPTPRPGGPQSEIEVARQHIDAYNRRDLRALRALSHPDLVLDWSASNWIGAGVYRGIDAVVAFYADYFDAFEQIIVEPERITLTGDAVVIQNVARLRGRDGIEVVARSTLALTVRRGKVAEIHLCR